MEKKLKILVIEDNQDIRENTSEILELAGFEVYQAANGKQGVEMAFAHLPQVILCDIMMPELDGYGVLYKLSMQPSTSMIPFIFLTAKTGRTDIRKAMEMGADDYLTKPFGDVELLNAINCRLKKKDQQELVLSQSLDKMETLFSVTSGLEELKNLAAQRKIRQVKHKQVIYYNGDNANGIYLVISGNVKTFKVAEDGHEFLTGVYGPDEYFGIAATLSGEDHKETAEAMKEVTLCLLPKNTIDEMIRKYPDVAKSFIKILANNVLSAEEQLLQLAYHSVRTRMAELLIRLKAKCGSDDLSTMNLSRDNLAGMAGIATETVSRILRDFNEEGLISKSLSHIRILNSATLEKMK
jgi:CRP-like cAMP-binding protein